MDATVFSGASVHKVKHMANLLVTYDPNHKGRAEEEIKAVLNEAGEKAELEDSKISGVFLVTVADAKKAVQKLSSVAGKMNYTFHWVPIEKWVPADIAKMQKAIGELKLDKDKSWKLDLSKRHYEASGHDLIEKLTEPIENKHVDLKNPEQIVKVEILGDKAGISVLKPSEILTHKA